MSSPSKREDGPEGSVPSSAKNNKEVECTDCEELVALDDSVSAGGARCIWRRCKKCHSTRKALRTWFSKAERLKDWEAMSTEERRKLIIQNKDKGAGKGHRRRVVVNEEVTCTDSLKLQSDKPFMTKKQFIAHLKSRYEWADADFQAEWEAAKSNPMAVWAKDEYGEWTVSLLRVATASSARELTSAKGVRQQEQVETDDMEATLSSAVGNASLHQETRIFDQSRMNHFQSMPLLPGTSQPLALTGGGSVKTGKGKAKAKGKAKSLKPEEDPSTPKARKRKGDEELFQLDLKRQQISIQRNAASTVDEWSDSIQQSLVACASNTNLADYRNLVENRWAQLVAFASEKNSPSKLSPSSRQIKSDVFQKEGPLKEASIKGFKKKMNGYLQGLSNACDRLNSVQREEEGNSEEEPGAVEDEPKATAPVVLASMEHLPEDQLNLLRQISAAFAEVRRETPEGEDVAFSYGCVNDGLPSDPSKHTTAAYFASSIPLPELGALPRTEIVEELQSDRAKDVKQRRDMESAHSSVALKSESFKQLAFSVAGCSMVDQFVDTRWKNNAHAGDIKKMLAMKMLYYKNSWSCANVSDLLQPSAKFQLSGGKLVVAAPYTSLAASIRAKSPGTPVTVASMTHHMLRMDMSEFDEAGGLAVRMVEGDFLWIPEACVIAEFAMSEPDEISTSLSWLGMTEYQCSDEHLENAIQSIQTLLVMCCQPSQRHLESGLKAGHAAFQKILEIKRKTGDEVKEEDDEDDATPAVATAAPSQPNTIAAINANPSSGNKDGAAPAVPAVTGAPSEPNSTAARPPDGKDGALAATPADPPSGNKDDANASPPPPVPTTTGAPSQPSSTAATPANANGNKDDAAPAEVGAPPQPSGTAATPADANPPSGNKDDGAPAGLSPSEPNSTAAAPPDGKDDALGAPAAPSSPPQPSSTAATPAYANPPSGNNDDANTSPAPGVPITGSQPSSAPATATAADVNTPNGDKDGAGLAAPPVTGAPPSEPNSTAALPDGKDDALAAPAAPTTPQPSNTAATPAEADANPPSGNKDYATAVPTTGAASQSSSTAATLANGNATPLCGSKDAISKSQPDRHVIAADGNQPKPDGTKDAFAKSESTDPKVNPVEVEGVCDLVVDILSSQEEEPADGHPAGPCPPEPKTIATAMDVSSEEEGAGAVNDPEVRLNTGKDERTKEDMTEAAAEKPTTEKKDADKHDPDSDSSSESNSESEAPSSKHGLAEESDEPASPAPTPKAAPKRRAARAKASPKAKAKGKCKAKASPKAKAKRGPRACRPKASPKPKPATACKSKAKAKEVAEKLSAELQESGSGKKTRKRKNADE